MRNKQPMPGLGFEKLGGGCHLLRKRIYGVKEVRINLDLMFRNIKLERKIRHAN